MKIKIVIEKDDGTSQTVELGEWTHERHLFVMSGVELAAYMEAQEGIIHVKTSRCVQCGKCCLDLAKGQYELDENKNCIHLEKEGPDKRPCNLGIMRPFPCVEGDPIKGKWGKDFCSIRYDGEK